MRNILLLPLLLIATPAMAALWKVDAAKSHLMFEGEQSGEKFKGEFKSFTPTIEFDPAHPEQGKIEVVIDMGSVTIEGKDRQDALPTSDWFDVKKFPTATFKSTSIKATGSDKSGLMDYEAKGNLTVRGISKEATLGFWLKTTGNSAESRGVATLNRSDYGIGQGEWKSDAYIKFPVTVSFEIHATK